MLISIERPLCVKDVMVAKPIAIRSSASPRALAGVLIEHSISGVPVIDDHDRLVGVVSRTDLLQWCVKGGLGFGAGDLLNALADGGSGTRLEAIDLGIVADFMTCAPVTARPEETVSEAARRMAEHHIHRLIVMDEAGALCGIVTSLDLLRVFPQMEHTVPTAHPANT